MATKTQLANELRNRQASLTDVELKEKLQFSEQEIVGFKKQLATISDDEIIDAYITCPCCGEKQVDDKDALAKIIKSSRSVNDFLKKCGVSNNAKHKKKEQDIVMEDGQRL
jgi:hypothetical protein